MPRLPSPFRSREHAPSRLEAFSDAVFAFAVTLLVVSLDVPQTFAELKALTAGFLGFALSFAMIVMLWRTHTRFFERFPLGDTTTLWLNSILLFLVLFFVYPLKFLFTLVSSVVVGDAVFGGVRPMESGDGPQLMLLYGGGFVAVFLVFALMYAHALRRADALGLTAPERAQTRTEAESLLLIALIGVLSVGVAYLPAPLGSLSGFVYFLIGPTVGLHAGTVGRRRLQRALDAEAAPELPATELPTPAPPPTERPAPEPRSSELPPAGPPALELPSPELSELPPDTPPTARSPRPTAAPPTAP